VKVALFLLASTLVRLLLVFRFPLAPDETYYWEWSRHLDGGYYDQGPMIAWWIRASCLLFGDTLLGVRFGIVLAALLTQVFLYLLARDLFDSRTALLALIPSTITPLALAGGFIATYDSLAALFWAAALYLSARALFFGSRRAWIGLGAVFGLGLLSKHTMLLFAPCLLLFLATVPAQRVRLRRAEPYLAALVALAVFTPNLWWQANHDWMTFRHLFLLTGKGADNPFLRRLGDFVGSQAGLLTPLLFCGLIAALIWAWRRGRQPGGERLWFLFCLSAPALLFFLLMTVKSKVQANWAALGWMTPPILYMAWLEERRRAHGMGVEARPLPYSHTPAPLCSPTAHRYAVAAMVLCALLSLLLLWPEARAAVGLRTPAGWDQMNKLYGGEELGAEADRVRREMEAEGVGPVAVGAATYDNASRLAFYMAGRPETCCFFLGTRINSYVLWNERGYPKPGGSALVADDRPPDDPGLPRYRAIFERVEPIPEPVAIYRRGLYDRPVRTYYLYRCYGYRPDPVVERPKGG